ncbi:PLA2G10 isoform 1, partial [Pan troglodytes]
CCHGHDCCYTRAEEAGCSPKTERYSWQCVNQSVLC